MSLLAMLAVIAAVAIAGWGWVLWLIIDATRIPD